MGSELGFICTRHLLTTFYKNFKQGKQKLEDAHRGMIIHVHIESEIGCISILHAATDSKPNILILYIG